MKQFNELKAQVGDALLLFRMGDFYELFGDDAVEAAKILEITLTSRDRNKPNPMPMAGVPHHSVQGYIQRLLKAGKKVAIGEQVEDPSKVTGKNIVKREIVRTFSPGVQFDLEGSEAAYLATAVPLDGDTWILACLDASTGECLLSQALSSEAAAMELTSLPVKQVLRLASKEETAGSCEAPVFFNTLPSQLLIEKLPSNYLSQDQARDILKSHYELAHLDAFVPDDSSTQALGLLVTYVLRSQKQERLAHLRPPMPLHQPSTLVLGPRTAQHLDLLPSENGGQNLFALINRTRSALGSRCLRRWLLEPLMSSTEIFKRQEAVRELSANKGSFCDNLSKRLSQVYDLERIAGRVNARLANPRDTLALGRSLVTLPELATFLADVNSPRLRTIRESLIELSTQLFPLGKRIVETQREDAPLITRDGGIFNLGTHPDLDHLLTLSENGARWLLELEAREREVTGIASLKVRYNRVFGYYIEVTSTHLKNVPAHYQRKQTTVGAERFFTEELKKFEDEIVNAGARQKSLEQGLFEDLLESARALTEPLMRAARCLGELDALCALGLLSHEPGWVFPNVDDSLSMQIEEGRHPLVDLISRGTFVPNDLKLSPDSQLTLVITGPNMGGKSTVMRQTALIVILGQMGAPVPATAARWGAVSRLYTRIGAHDAISRGQSTFMVEMSELAHILHHADERSLIILDEIGRGTSTYDGISVAWSTLEWICSKIRCRTLFATHYHELTRLASDLPLMANAHMAVEGTRAATSRLKNAQTQLRFLYQLREGPAAESFGIHVARIAGIPRPVVERAWSVLEELEKHSLHSGTQAAATDQLSLFSGIPPVIAEPEPNPVVEALEKTDVNELTPVQALNFVVKLQGMMKKTQLN